jgi:hypothetical protein
MQVTPGGPVREAPQVGEETVTGKKASGKLGPPGETGVMLKQPDHFRRFGQSNLVEIDQPRPSIPDRTRVAQRPPPKQLPDILGASLTEKPLPSMFPNVVFAAIQRS